METTSPSKPETHNGWRNRCNINVHRQDADVHECECVTVADALTLPRPCKSLAYQQQYLDDPLLAASTFVDSMYSFATTKTTCWYPDGGYVVSPIDLQVNRQVSPAVEVSKFCGIRLLQHVLDEHVSPKETFADDNQLRHCVFDCDLCVLSFFLVERWLAHRRTCIQTSIKFSLVLLARRRLMFSSLGLSLG